MRVAVTGATGTIGREVVRQLSSRGDSVVAVSRDPGSAGMEAVAWDGLNRVLLLSDGLANVGVTDPNAIQAEVRAMAGRRVGTSTIGQREFFLYPGDNATVTLQWDTRGLAGGDYSIMVQATILGNTDGNTTNNSLSGSVTLNQPGGSSSLLPYLIAAAAAAAVIAITFLVLRRRRVPHPTPAM